ncbi:uncharacterized protein LOC116602249 isoform X3 [Nematostella vectensis]|uniref:uncharacterized protein LOC116602249 isoform X3 n=1 Tax=Nematostella vectensis TaxID=45351 RepID=UPI0020770E97|nr:uncharacterized protein LOC116602249 isoform X3 [Nematostella vectensis]
MSKFTGLVALAAFIVSVISDINLQCKHEFRWNMTSVMPLTNETCTGDSRCVTITGTGLNHTSSGTFHFKGCAKCSEYASTSKADACRMFPVQAATLLAPHNMNFTIPDCANHVTMEFANQQSCSATPNTTTHPPTSGPISAAFTTRVLAPVAVFSALISLVW